MVIRDGKKAQIQPNIDCRYLDCNLLTKIRQAIEREEIISLNKDNQNTFGFLNGEEDVRVLIFCYF